MFTNISRNTIFNFNTKFMNKHLEHSDIKAPLPKKQSLFANLKNSLLRDLNKIAKKFPSPPVLNLNKPKDFDRQKFVNILLKKQRYLRRSMYEISDYAKLSKIQIQLAELNYLLLNKDKVNDDEVLEMYFKLRKGT